MPKATEWSETLGARFRRRRSAHIRAIIEQVYERTGGCRILDVGGSQLYWSIFEPDYLLDRKVSIQILNIKPVQVTGRPFLSVIGDGMGMRQYSDGEFDFAHSNSVIEHVGGWEQMERFAAEVRRVGRSYFVQTPNFWFPWEPHFCTLLFHWLPEPVRISMMMRRDLGFHRRASAVGDAVRAVRSAQLLERKMLGYLFPDAEIVQEKLLGLTKSLIAIRRGRPGLLRARQ